MSHKTACPRCSRASLDGSLCERCAENISQGLLIIVNWWPDLWDTITRQSRTTARTEGRVIGHDKPLPFDAPAAELANEIRQVLVQWVLLTVDELGAAYPRDRIKAMADHIRDWLPKLRKHPAVCDLAHEIARLANMVMRAIDTADGQLVHVPRVVCVSVTDGVRCGGELVAAIRRDWFAESFIRCQSCTRTWSAQEWAGLHTESGRLDDLEDAELAELEDEPGPVRWVTAQRIAELYGVSVVHVYNAANKGKWERQKVGRLVVYSVADVEAWREKVA